MTDQNPTEPIHKTIARDAGTDARGRALLRRAADLARLSRRQARTLFAGIILGMPAGAVTGITNPEDYPAYETWGRLLVGAGAGLGGAANTVLTILLVTICIRLCRRAGAAGHDSALVNGQLATALIILIFRWSSLITDHTGGKAGGMTAAAVILIAIFAGLFDENPPDPGPAGDERTDTIPTGGKTDDAVPTSEKPTVETPTERADEDSANENSTRTEVTKPQADRPTGRTRLHGRNRPCAHGSRLTTTPGCSSG